MSLCSVWSGRTQQAFTCIRGVNGGKPKVHCRWLDQLLTNKKNINTWFSSVRHQYEPFLHLAGLNTPLTGLSLSFTTGFHTGKCYWNKYQKFSIFQGQLIKTLIVKAQFKLFSKLCVNQVQIQTAVQHTMSSKLLHVEGSTLTMTSWPVYIWAPKKVLGPPKLWARWPKGPVLKNISV